MALSDEHILRQNPWWARAGWEGDDPHLALLARQPARLSADIVADLDLGSPGIHVLRGPRQVGKSTDLKLLVERALGTGMAPRSVVYLALDLLEGRHLSELAATVERALDLAEAADSEGLLLLDEVTAVRGWQTAVKSLWDQGAVRDRVIVCTGSSAVDLQRGAAERLPGRRGAGSDHLVLPQSFASFASALDASLPASPRLSVAEMLSEDGFALLRAMRVHAPALETALRRYLRFGGLPAAVAEAASGVASPSGRVRRVLHDSLVRELQRRGASVTAGNALLERVVRSLGAKVSWSAMAREMDVPLGRGEHTGHQTLREYIELLAGGYFLFVVHFWRSGSPSGDLSRDKKVFLADPLLHSIAQGSSPGLRTDEPALVENAIAIALLRRYEDPSRLIETFALPDRLHIWQTARGGEIDFVCGPRRQLDVVEVKYRERPPLTAAAAAARAHPGRPVAMATKRLLQPGDRYTLIPAHMLLWALG